MHKADDSSTSSSDPTWRTILLGLGLPFVLSLAAIAVAGWRHREALRLPTESQAAIGQTVLPMIERGRRLPEPVARVAFFGDSTSQCHGTNVAPLLQQGLTGRPPITFVIDVSFPAFRPIHFYYLLEDVIAAKPQVAIVEIDLGYLAGNPAGWRALRYVNLARYMRVSRALRVREGLVPEEVGVFDPWLYQIEAASDMQFVPEGIHDWATTRLDDWGIRFNHALGLSNLDHSVRGLRTAVFGPQRVRIAFGSEQWRHPGAMVLRAIHRELRAAGIATLFYVTPVPVDRIAKMGFDARLVLPPHIERLRQFLEATPDEWLDLHSLVSDDAIFRDLGHMDPPGCTAVANALMEKLRSRGLPHGPGAVTARLSPDS